MLSLFSVNNVAGYISSLFTTVYYGYLMHLQQGTVTLTWAKCAVSGQISTEHTFPSTIVV
jgi:hypothetical protein